MHRDRYQAVSVCLAKHGRSSQALVVLLGVVALAFQAGLTSARIVNKPRPAQHHGAAAHPPVHQMSALTPLPTEIATSTTLTAAHSPYVIHDSVTVDNKAILTIQPGVVIKFDQGTALQIGGGEGSPGFLIAKGVKTGPNGALVPAPIHFLATLPNPTHGYWSGIVFNNSQYRSIMDYCDVSNAGAGGDPAIRVAGGNAPTITNCSITWGDGDGVNAEDGSFTSFDGNTIAHFKGTGMTISCEAAGAVGPHNQLVDNGHDYIHLIHGVHHDEHWTNSTIPFFSDGGIQVESSVDGKDATLTVDPGVHIIFAHDQKFTLGWNNTGSLNAVGTADKPIVLSGSPDWAGVEAPKAKKVGLNYCVLQNAAADAPALHAVSGQVALTHCTISNGGRVGVSASDDARFTAFHGNTIAGMKGAPVELDARQVAGLESENKLTGNGQDVVRINDSSVDTDSEWKPMPVPLQAMNGIKVEGAADGQSATLTLDPGVVIRFGDDKGITVGWNNSGNLKAVGTQANPVILTSSEQTPGKGDWGGVNLNKSGSGTDLENVRIEYAGTKDGDAALRGGDGSRGKIASCTIAHSGNGVNLKDTRITVDDLKFEDVDSGATVATQ